MNDKNFPLKIIGVAIGKMAEEMDKEIMDEYKTEKVDKAIKLIEDLIDALKVISLDLLDRIDSYDNKIIAILYNRPSDFKNVYEKTKSLKVKAEQNNRFIDRIIKETILNLAILNNLKPPK